LKIELHRIIDSGSPDPPISELIVINDDYDGYDIRTDDFKREVHCLPEEWADRFLRLMEKIKRPGTLWASGATYASNYVGHSLYRPKENEEEVEALYFKFKKFKKILIRKRFIKVIIFLGLLMGLVLIVF